MNNPWTSYYTRMEQEVPHNEAEAIALKLMAKPQFDLDRILRESGLSWPEYKDLAERAGQWEIENMCVKGEPL